MWGPPRTGMVQTGTDASCWGPWGNRKLPTGVLALWWGLGSTSREPVPAMREAPALSAVQDATALARVYQSAWTERGKNWKTKAPSPQSLPAEAWGRQARGGRLRRREGGGVAAAPEHKNNEARGAMGPSRLVPESLSDLDRCHSWAPGEEPRHTAAEPAPASLRPGRWRFRQAPTPGSHPTTWEQEDLRGQLSWRRGGRVWRQGSGGRALQAGEAAVGSPEGTLALRCGYVRKNHTKCTIVLV